MSKQIEANHRRNLIVREIAFGTKVYLKDIFNFAVNSGIFTGDAKMQVRAILSHLKRKGIVKRYGNLFVMAG